jgi:signal transduction histidine kinase
MTTLMDTRGGASNDSIGFFAILNQLPLGVGFCLGSLHVVGFVNPTLRALWVDREPAGKQLAEAYPELASQGHVVFWDRAFSTGEGCSIGEVPVRVRRRAEVMEEAFLHLVLCPLRNAEGGVIGVLTFIVDITESVRARRRAEASAARMFDLLRRATAVADASLDAAETLESLLRLVVPGFADFCQIDLLDDEGRPASVASAHVQADKDALLREMDRKYPPLPHSPRKRVLDTGRSELVREVGDRILGESANSPEHRRILDALGARSSIIVPLRTRGRTLGALSMSVAESERTYTEEDLALAEDLGHRAALALDNARLHREAKAAIEARDDLLAVVSHDLKTPLSVISICSSVLQRKAESGSPDPAAYKQIMTIQRSSARMANLIGDLLDAASLAGGHFSMEAGIHEMRLVLEDAMEAMRTVAQDKAVRLECVDEFDDHPHVLCDREKIVRVYANLIGNAIKFTPAGGTVIVKGTSTKDEVVISIEDTGVGIAEAHLPHIFERFWRLERKSRGGSGLGLFIAKGIIEAHGGRIWVESKLEAGSTFRFSLPRIE